LARRSLSITVLRAAIDLPGAGLMRGALGVPLRGLLPGLLRGLLRGFLRDPLRALVAACSLGCTLGLGATPAAPVDPATFVFTDSQARAALALLAEADSHGLDPRDYGLPALQRALEAPGRPTPDAAARLQQMLAAALLRYLQDLHDGRITPAQLGQRFRPTRGVAFDAAATLHAALAAQDLRLAERQAAPPLPQYQRLREALARYRALADHPAWRQGLPTLPLPPGERVRALALGQPWPGLPTLAARLAALGDLPAAEPAPGPDAAYEGALVSAVQAFQQRHGLAADGVVGRATLAALQAPPAQRVRQLELALERLRWTPLLQGPRMIVINVPEFVLRAYEVQGTRVAVRAEMKVIVGKALDTRTPLIQEDLRFIEFKPFWNVPASIARHELVPRLRRDPGHWAREGFEFVGAGRADPVLTEAKLQAVLAGQLRIRQRPGPRNALGDIKFVFPNRESVYLHHTPSVQLFERARRDFSHGCIRVEQPVALAQFALQGLPEWTEERIRAAMAAADPATVTLPQPVPVLLAYGTALVKDARVYFFDDLYGHDRALDAALRQRKRPPIGPAPP
jgi:murein L,D-transpeptidase YcbB/YkuD